jgi:hypothetical protein
MPSNILRKTYKEQIYDQHTSSQCGVPLFSLIHPEFADLIRLRNWKQKIALLSLREMKKNKEEAEDQ